jgi:uncharacterized protein (TIGR02147 family)
MSIFKHNSYKDYVLAYVQSSGSRGLFSAMAKAMGMNSSSISQVFRGPLDLNLDQAFALTEFLTLENLEREYFLLLVQRDRAGTNKLKKHIEAQIKAIQKKAQQAQGHVSQHEELQSVDQSEFYSDWTYSAIRLATSIPGLHSPEAISKYFSIPVQKVTRILDFLVKRGLCIKRDNEYGIGTSMTHLSPESPFAPRHLANWRLKAIEHHSTLRDDELAFSSALTLSRADFAKIKELLLDTVKKTYQIVGPSQNEVLGCINIDWFEVK